MGCSTYVGFCHDPGKSFCPAGSVAKQAPMHCKNTAPAGTCSVKRYLHVKGFTVSGTHGVGSKHGARASCIGNIG